jgi:hypothetical protein
MVDPFVKSLGNAPALWAALADCRFPDCALRYVFLMIGRNIP